MTQLSVGDSVRVKDGYVDETGNDVRAGYGGQIVELHDDVAEIAFVGLRSGAEFTGTDPVPVRVEWLEPAD